MKGCSLVEEVGELGMGVPTAQRTSEHVVVTWDVEGAQLEVTKESVEPQFT